MYVYQEHRPFVFTEEGQEKLLNVIAHARQAFAVAGAVTAEKLLGAAGAGDSWQNMAIVDRFVELGYAGEFHMSGQWQGRVFVPGKKLP